MDAVKLPQRPALCSKLFQSNPLLFVSDAPSHCTLCWVDMAHGTLLMLPPTTTAAVHQALIKLIQVTKNPVICICNAWDPRLPETSSGGLMAICQSACFRKPCLLMLRIGAMRKCDSSPPTA